MIQTPYLNPCASQPMLAPSYNAVKIDVHNPSVNAPGSQPMCSPQQTYAMPQSQLYNYPQSQTQPFYMPPQQTYVLPPATQQIQQQNINAPAPVVTQQPAEAQKVEIVPPEQITPQVDINSFIAKLTNPDYEVQANAMEEIANMVNSDPQKATELLDEKVVNALNAIMTADTSKLTGPTPEQVAARAKLMKGEQLSEDEKKLASTVTPMEQAERNKSYAMFTTAIMQKLFMDEVKNLTNAVVPLTELPGAIAIVDQLKNNPNPMVRTSAVEALSYIQNPEYKKDLETLFTISKNDKDKNVQDASDAALKKLGTI